MAYAPVTGTDQHSPQYDPDGRWTIWARHQLYYGLEGLGKYVPNVGDYVQNIETGDLLKVVSVDETTFVPELGPTRAVEDGGEDVLDVLEGDTPDTFRVFVNKTVTPNVVCVDKRTRVHGSMVTTARIIRPAPTVGEEDTVVSAVYNASGEFVGRDIPLEVVSIPNTANYTTKAVPNCYTTYDLQPGEYLYVHFFSPEGLLVSKAPVVVEESTFISNAVVASRQVTSISLWSPWLSVSEPNLLRFPVNIPMNGLGLFGRVHYADGSMVQYPVDGTRFEVHGLKQYQNTIVGATINLSLKYKLQADEVNMTNVPITDNFISKAYRAITEEVNGAYSLKLFGYPVWINAVQGYRMEWWMCSLDREEVFNVTPHVRFNPALPAFQPLAYGVTQTLSVSVDLSQVAAGFVPHVHTQLANVTLLAPSTDEITAWTIRSSAGDDPVYGHDVYIEHEFINANLARIEFKTPATTLAEFLEHAFYKSAPLYYPDRESQPPAPNFFTIVIGVTEQTFPIESWDQIMQINNLTITNYGTIFVKWVKRTDQTDLFVGVTGFSVYPK